MSRELIGSNREVVGSPAYFEKLHNAHFDGTLRYSRGDDFARSLESLADNRFCSRFKLNLERIVRELERDLEQGLRDNDYIRDENAENLRATLKQLERCGVRCYSLERKVDDLAWFVGGDPDKIRKLQQKLNELGIGERLKEDGVFGRKTLESWLSFINRLENGVFPTLKWADPLKNNSRPLEIGSSLDGINNVIQDVELIDTFKNRGKLYSENRQYFRIDAPHLRDNGTYGWGNYRGEMRRTDYPHINVNFGETPTKFQAWLKKRYNHYPLDDITYNAVKDLQQFGKKVRVAGKVLLIAGTALDVLEVGLAAIEDLTDTDEKLGKKTLSSAVGVAGRWGGAVAGAKIGMGLGALTGPAAPVAVPVLSLAGGLAGSFGGDALGRWIIDITVTEE